MTLESRLVAVLKEFTPRTFTDFAPTSTARPYITFQQIGGQVVRQLANEVPSVENAEVQINVWADTRSDAKSLILQIEAALITGATMRARPLAASVSDFDADMERFCSRQDFSIWCDR